MINPSDHTFPIQSQIFYILVRNVFNVLYEVNEPECLQPTYLRAYLVTLGIMNLHFLLSSDILTESTNLYIPSMLSIKLSVYFVCCHPLALFPSILPSKQSLSIPCAHRRWLRNCSCLFSVFPINSLFTLALLDTSSFVTLSAHGNIYLPANALKTSKRLVLKVPKVQNHR